MKILQILPWTDWVALGFFLLIWVGYTLFAKHSSDGKHSILAMTNRYRHQWMLQTTARDPRMLDGIITQTLSATPAFFCSTTILILGGLFALLGTTDKAAELVREVPFAVQTPILVFEFKILVLVVIFVYAFFRFSWSMRQYTFVALLIGGMPPAEDFASGEASTRHRYADRAAAMTGLAAETFNGGLRAYYFSFAALGWFFSPTLFALATLLVAGILYSREFKSEVLALLEE
ncbi:DUF599 domain-containing protein [Limnohabitans sp.]|jgi:uncharacterized membrane protein|uniref:DUF599 domain-containing protein n=1 Tax=Limnohabitans sp. TaxID=1907725 RepID=UPI0033426D98